MTPSWSTAATYPPLETIGSVTIDDKDFVGGLAGASLVARDGTYPMRALVRCLAQESNRIWHKSNDKNDQKNIVCKKKRKRYLSKLETLR